MNPPTEEQIEAIGEVLDMAYQEGACTGYDRCPGAPRFDVFFGDDIIQIEVIGQV